MSLEDSQAMSTNLRNFNIEQSKGLSTKPETSFNLTLKSETGDVAGGIRSRAFYQSLTVDFLWIDERFRRMGYGKDLMMKVERMAKEAGCISANTMTYSFKAPQFYEKLGYKIVGAFEEYPESIKKFFLEKKL
ncbi:GNAT family N-acetyltransferase [Candidatus Thorarchaeota archaeon]|nr:MAG: GNAT family N-acetyltransferase [Candidatus Thorarchaeota archaeon]